MNESRVPKIALAVLSLPASFFFTVITAQFAAKHSFLTPGDWAAWYIVPRLGLHNNLSGLGLTIEVQVGTDMVFWLVVIWATYLVIGKLLRKNGAQQ
jgi:hypothetical protein